MRVGVIDIGTNSTRLFVADVVYGELRPVERRSIVTRLGEGVDATGVLGDAPQQRVLSTLATYVLRMDDHRCARRAAIMTSAVRDAHNGAAFAEVVRDTHGLDARTLSGDEEAQLTFRGATTGRSAEEQERLVVADIGGGSTELVTPHFHVSTQVGVVRHSERHIANDPPLPSELAALRADVREQFDRELPGPVRAGTSSAVAVAGTATSSAAIDLGLTEYDANRVEGHRLTRARTEAMLDELATVPLGRRQRIPGLHPDRAPTIVTGLAILLEVLDAFALDGFEASDHDILWGMSLKLAAEA